MIESLSGTDTDLGRRDGTTYPPSDAVSDRIVPMQKRFTGIFLAAVFAGSLPSQATLIPHPYGSGADGVFAPTTDVTIDTSTKTCLQFRSFQLPAGVTLTVVGNNPLYIKVQGACRVDGKIESSGAAGAPGKANQAGGIGGVGGAGGGRGGIGGASAASPFLGTGGDGTGSRPGVGGKDAGPVPGTFLDPVGGGGGGGNASAGAKGGDPNGTKKTPNVSGAGGKSGVCRAGSGGGGGGGDIDSLTKGAENDGGAGGGGGGGWVTIAAPAIGIAGEILCAGGAGGVSSGNGGGGGGGAGGGIDLISQRVTFTGTLSAVGGVAGAATQSNCGCSPGGAGGNGCINVYGSITGNGAASPKPTIHTNGLVVNAACPMDVAIKTILASDKFLTGIGVIPLTPPWSSPWGTVCTVDDIFLTTLFRNNSPGLKNSNGTGAGTLQLSDPGLKLSAADVEVIMQAVTVNSSNVITGISNCVKIILKL
jgi:hypothetical protein